MFHKSDFKRFHFQIISKFFSLFTITNLFLFIWYEWQCCSMSTGNDISGPQFSQFFFFFLISQKLFPDRVSHFRALWWSYWILNKVAVSGNATLHPLQRCGVAGIERVPPYMRRLATSYGAVRLVLIAPLNCKILPHFDVRPASVRLKFTIFEDWMARAYSTLVVLVLRVLMLQRSNEAYRTGNVGMSVCRSIFK